MKYTYDFHIHTALSPCGHEDMSPSNIVNMAKLLELDAIAITDHNSSENIAPIMEIARGEGILVIPGMEIETREEIHVVCFFSTLSGVYNMQEIVYKGLPQIENREKIFGEQLIFDKENRVVGKNTRLLSTAVNISIDELFNICKDLGGVAVPAHIDRPSYSILSNLGEIPTNLGVTAVEISKYVDDKDTYCNRYQEYRVLQSSDAHDLESLVYNHGQIELEELTVEAVLKYLKGM